MKKKNYFKPTAEQRAVLAAQVSEARKRLGISQEELGYIIGVAGSTISNIEICGNYSLVIYKVVSAWIEEQEAGQKLERKRPEQNPEPEVLTGEWNGIPITYHNPYRGHNLTQEEWADLCNGRQVVLRGMTKYDKELGRYITDRPRYDMVVQMEVPEGTTRVMIKELAWINYPKEYQDGEKPQLILAPDALTIRAGIEMLEQVLEEVER